MKKKIILIMGLPGSGKTTLAKKISRHLKAEWLNADKIRGKFNDWDFSKVGILRQVRRMRKLANMSKKKYVIADFICPLAEQRKIFKPNLIIWMDTIKKGRFKKMNKLFKKPEKYNLKISEKNLNLNFIKTKNLILGYKWDNKRSTVQMLGRFQPWHEGHTKIFENSILRADQVLIMVKDVNGIGDNPYSFNQIKSRIQMELKEFKNMFRVVLAPNITEICYGRTVGYKISKINLPKKIESISATKIRKRLRLKGLLK